MRWLITLFVLTHLAVAQDMQALRVQAFFRDTAEALIVELTAAPVDLKSTLSRGTIGVSDAELIDNTGSLVDAIGVPGKVTLSKERWLLFIREDRDVRLLVVHELLRMAGVNDDNYLVSRQLMPGLAPVAGQSYCDLRVARLSYTTRTARMSSEGFGGNSVEQAYSNAARSLRERCQARNFPDATIQSAALSMVRRNTNGFSVIENKVVMRGQCRREDSRPRPRREQSREACRKVSLCEDLLASRSISPLSSTDANELAELQQEWSCR
jgi:hypothetical protein